MKPLVPSTELAAGTKRGVGHDRPYEPANRQPVNQADKATHSVDQ
jgi:hypothetical protein